ncbi:MAG: methionine--tRNA ligase, partial [Pseudomonadota bacterium]
GAQETALIKELSGRIRTFEGHMDAIELRKASQELRAIWVAGNEYLQEAAPWSTFKEDPEKAAAQIRLALNLIRLYAVLSASFIPDAAARMLSAMNTLDMSWPDDVAEALNALPEGHEFAVPDVLFAKISDEQREEWATRFAGKRD